MICPVMKLALSEARNTIACATSSGRPMRLTGMFATNAAFRSAVPVKRVNMSVSIGPGAAISSFSAEATSWPSAIVAVAYLILRGVTVPVRIAFGVGYAVFFVPMTYWMDGLVYRRFERRRARETFDRVLARRVDRAARSTPLSEARGDVDDAAAALRLHNA